MLWHIKNGEGAQERPGIHLDAFLGRLLVVFWNMRGQKTIMPLAMMAHSNVRVVLERIRGKALLTPMEVYAEWNAQYQLRRWQDSFDLYVQAPNWRQIVIQSPQMVTTYLYFWQSIGQKGKFKIMRSRLPKERSWVQNLWERFKP